MTNNKEYQNSIGSQTESPTSGTGHPKSAIWYKKLNHGWALETSSSIFSLACTLGMIILLSNIHGKLLSSWASVISPNAFISVLSTAARASLILPVTESISQLKWLHLAGKSESKLLDLQIFDNASRGPLGAAKFLYSIRNASFIPYIGCIVTLAALAFEPFSQQLLAFDEIDTQQLGLKSSVQQSHTYDFQSMGLTGVSGVIRDPRDIPMRTAINNGLFGQISSPPFACSGSRCDYPSFTSLGVCSDCNDVSDQVTIKYVGAESGSPVREWIFGLPGNFSLMASAVFDAHSGFVHTLVNSTTSTNQSDDKLTSLAIIKFPSLGASDGPGKDEWVKLLQAYTCSVYLCEQSYANWTTANGTLNPGTRRGSRLDRTADNMFEGPLIEFMPMNNNLSEASALSINIQDITNVGMLLDEVFNFKLNTGQSGVLNSYEVALYNSPDLPATIDNITTSMSYRMLSGPNSTTLYGNAYAPQTYVFVRWEWITLPVVIELFACGFLIIVMYMTRQARHLIWKSSLTPLLLTDDSYPLTDAQDKPFWTTSQLRTRKLIITNHLTQ